MQIDIPKENVLEQDLLDLRRPDYENLICPDYEGKRRNQKRWERRKNNGVTSCNKLNFR